MGKEFTYIDVNPNNNGNNAIKIWRNFIPKAYTLKTLDMNNFLSTILTPNTVGVVFIPTLVSYSTSLKLAKTPTLNNHWIDEKKQIIIAKLEIVEETENALGPRNYCTTSSEQDNQNSSQKPNPDNHGIMEFLQSLIMDLLILN